MKNLSRLIGNAKIFAVFLGRKAGILLFVAFAIAGGYFLGRSGDVARAPMEMNGVDEHAAHEEAAPQMWTCSMHPQVMKPEAGLCPICAMDLVPVPTDSAPADVGDRVYTTTEAAKALMNIQTHPVERKFAPTEIRMVGKIDFDETQMKNITSWVAGRIDRLYVDYTGVEVKKGDHMVYIYSPEILAAQDELRRASEAVDRLGPNSPDVLKETTSASLTATREKLRRWGLTEAQINDAEEKGSTSDHITMYAPVGGTVIHMDGHEGMYVQEGTHIYTIVDLDTLWVQLDAYESDLQWLHLGQAVEFETEAYPGKVFSGTVVFINPVLDKKTRTVKVRVNVSNKDRLLKPDMFVRALVRAQVATDGRVMDPGLAGKWMAPMHPEIVKDGPGTCDICGMDLVRTEELGYVSADVGAEDKPLVIPATAPLITGKRAIVYVELPDREQPTFEGREIVLGPRTGDYYIVREGLAEGERVVTNGNFKIDSALQIMAKPSMMSPDGGRSMAGHDH